MGVRSRTSRGDAQLFQTAAAGPVFRGLAKQPSDALATQAIGNYQATDQRKGRALEPTLNGDFDPADHCVAEACHEGCLLGVPIH